MDELNIEEMIWHYQLLVNQTMDLLEDQERALRELKTLLDISWQGDIAEVVLEKLTELEASRKLVSEDLDEALLTLRRDLSLLEG